jgi:hypothetical protein
MAGNSFGINPLAIAAPDLYAKQIAIQRRQALGQALLQDGGRDAGNAAYGGLRNAGNAILGAFLLRNADKDMAGLYSPQETADTGQITNSARPAAAPSVQPVLSATGELDPQGNPMLPATNGAAMGFGNTPSAPQSTAPIMQSPRGNARTIPNALRGMVVQIPGMTKEASMSFFLTDPSAYYAKLSEAVSPTPEQRDYNAAYPNDPQAVQAGLQGLLAHNRTLNLRGGNLGYDQGTGQSFGVPNSAGVAPFMMDNGQVGMRLAPGAEQALAGSKYAEHLGKAAATPATAYDAHNLPVMSNQAIMSGNGNTASTLIPGFNGAPQGAPTGPTGPAGGAPLGIRSNNPGNLRPGGREAVYATPVEGVLRAASNLDGYAARGINTLAGIVSTWAPASAGNNTQAYMNFVSQKLGVPPNQPLNLKDPTVKGRVLDAMFAYENGPKAMQAAGAPQPQPLRPELPAGQADFMKGSANTAMHMRDQNIVAAEEVPTRINVLDNIDHLINSGAPVGSAEWQNDFRQTKAALQQAVGHTIQADNPAALMGEIQKYMGQYQLRMAKIQGGTGTDKQLEAVQHANPNDAMFPATLKRVVAWLKANEQGALAKANAQEAYLELNGTTPGAQLKFEQVWRNAYDPRVFQLQNMPPQDQAAFVKALSPSDARLILQKRQALRSMGAIQ